MEQLYHRDPTYQEQEKKREQLLNKLPQPNLSANLDELINNSIQLSLKGTSDFFISKKLKSAREKPDSEELMQKLLKKFEIEEYGTNFTKDVYDPKKIGDDSVVDDKKVLRPTVPNSFTHSNR
ncbi:unnamed protein product [Paramecium primaurelia]|uniref:Uncharacterized protein n=2 Tax=Paramecium TaxID=5884 RepID=A0A8S1TU19_9CILI|nr:unnamed protein product [Paramecium primaurelia]CAD8154456.1 unnamed protein product [Paramecium pentaurelia]